MFMWRTFSVAQVKTGVGPGTWLRTRDCLGQSLIPNPSFLAHSNKTNIDHGRDHEVCPARNEFHTDLTPSNFTSGLSASGTDLKLSSMRTFSGPRSHCSHGKVNVLFFREVTSAGNNLPSASTSNAFCTPGLRRASSGSAVINSTSGVSSSGTRTSNDRAML